MKKMILAALLLVTLVIGATPAKAIMTMELSGNTSSSIVNFSLYGSSTAAGSFGRYTDTVFNISSGPDLFPPAISTTGYGIFAILTGSGTVTNETSGVVSVISGIGMQDQTLFGVERFGADYPTVQQTNVGDVYSWTGFGTFDISSKGLVFGDLIAGVSFGRSVDGLDGVIKIDGANTPVPEPGTIALLGLGMAGLAVYGKRRKGNKA